MAIGDEDARTGELCGGGARVHEERKRQIAPAAAQHLSLQVARHLLIFRPVAAVQLTMEASTAQVTNRRPLLNQPAPNLDGGIVAVHGHEIDRKALESTVMLAARCGLIRG